MLLLDPPPPQADSARMKTPTHKNATRRTPGSRIMNASFVENRELCEQVSRWKANHARNQSRQSGYGRPFRMTFAVMKRFPGNSA